MTYQIGKDLYTVASFEKGEMKIHSPMRFSKYLNILTEVRVVRGDEEISFWFLGSNEEEVPRDWIGRTFETWSYELMPLETVATTSEGPEMIALGWECEHKFAYLFDLAEHRQCKHCKKTEGT